MRNVTQWLHYNRSHILRKHVIELTRFFFNTGVPTFSLPLAYYSKIRYRQATARVHHEQRYPLPSIRCVLTADTCKSAVNL